MPLYEYRCLECGQDVTIRARISDASPAHCATCGSARLDRLISRFSIAKSGHDRVRDLSWIDRGVSSRLREKASGELSPGFGAALDRMSSGR